MSFKLLDSGNFRKLEVIGKYHMVRPCPQAVWEPRLGKKEWSQVDDTYLRSSAGGGKWQKNTLPERWNVDFGGNKLLIKPTNFGHLGIFAEQLENWKWLESVAKEGMNTLNLFAYTGCSTLAMRRGGSFPTHCDAAKGIVEWARENAELNQLEGIRWIVDDAQKFLEREQRREKSYHGIVLDPPSYGRGSKGEIWKIETDLVPLLKSCKALMKEPKFLLLSCHSPHFSAKVLENLVVSLWGEKVEMESFEMLIPEESSRRAIPSGACVRVLFK
ncbi:MAG: class I SAM-dependent methyltransferase [Lentisphaeraceae bacterium]|nr:class I SAM-dependent methyltransferase [Lentisphaeraceae bacterium]